MGAGLSSARVHASRGTGRVTRELTTIRVGCGDERVSSRDVRRRHAAAEG